MAAKIIPHAKDATNLHDRIGRIIDEIGEETAKVFSVAAAGWSMAGDANPNERNLFAVIEGLTQDTELLGRLREAVAELADLASSHQKVA